MPSFTADLTLNNLSKPFIGFIASNFKFKAFGAKFSPPTTTHDNTDPTKSAARMGHIATVELMIFVFRKFVNVLLSAKTSI